MVKEMEELRKDNDTLRSMIKVYQVNGVPSVNKVALFLNSFTIKTTITTNSSSCYNLKILKKNVEYWLPKIIIRG